MKLEREPGKREARYVHLFCPENQTLSMHNHTNENTHTTIDANSPTLSQAFERIEQLEKQVSELTEQLNELLN